MRRARAALLLSAIAVLLALAASACSDDGGDDASAVDTAPAAAETPAPSTATEPPTTAPATQPPPATTAAAPATSTAAPTPTPASTTASTTAPTTQPPPTTAAPGRAGTALPPAVEGTLLEGEVPQGFDILQTDTNIPRAETCPGTASFGGIGPVAYSESTWASNALTGPFLDIYIARFESVEAASTALNNYRKELIACGEFPEAETGAVGSFRPGEDPELGDESFGTDFTATVQGLAVNRYGVVVRVGDSIYSSGLTSVFLEPDPAIVLAALDSFLGQ